MTTSGPNPGSGPENLGWGQMWSLLVVLEGVYIKRGHINHGFGPDVETFGVNPSQNNPKRAHLAQTQDLGAENLGLGQMWSLWVVLERVYTKTLLV